MKSAKHLQQHVQAMISGDPSMEEWPLLELVQQKPDARWGALPALLDAAATQWLSQVVSEIDVTALKAGLLLMHDFADESHSLAQSIEGQGAGRLGDYWHAILHRREPDSTNAKYWFRQIGAQPLFAEVARRAAAVFNASPSQDVLAWHKRLGGSDRWDPLAFVDLCESAREGDTELTQVAQAVQRVEMLLLVQKTHQQATGMPPQSG